MLLQCKHMIKDICPCLDRKLGIQSKEVPSDKKFSFLPTFLLLWETQLTQSEEIAFLFD